MEDVDRVRVENNLREASFHSTPFSVVPLELPILLLKKKSIEKTDMDFAFLVEFFCMCSFGVV